MSAGKAAAQASHATLGAYRRAMRLCPRAVRDWLSIGQMVRTAAPKHKGLHVSQEHGMPAAWP